MTRPDRAGSPGERRPLAGLAALGSVVCWVVALILANAGTHGTSPTLRVGGEPASLNRAIQLTDLHASAGDQALAVAFRCLGMLLVVFLATQLVALLRTRQPRASRRRLLGVGAGGAVLVAASTVFGYLALAHVADVFVAGSVHSLGRAQSLVNGSGALHVAAVLDLLSRVVLALWIAMISLELLRASLFDTTLAYWGFGAAAALVLLPIGDAMFIGWMASVGLLSLGYWPGGRPEAWSRAIPTGA